MKVKGITPILNVSDVPRSMLWFEKLGWSRGFAWNSGGMIDCAALENEHGPAHFGGMCANSEAEGEGPMVFMCKDGQGMRDPRPLPTGAEPENYGGVWMSWWVDDVDAAHAECVRAGGEVVHPPQDRPWHVRECLIRHPDGHYFRLCGQAKYARC